MSQSLAGLLVLLERHHGLLRLAVAALTLAWLLTKTSTSLLANLPLAILALLSLRWVVARLAQQQRARLLKMREVLAWRREPMPATPAPTFGVPASAAKPDSWRKFVRAPVVEEAWTRFCGSIVQEFIYDIWYSTITPDKEFPAEVRRLLNSGFGQLAARARQLDLRLVMNDLAELFMEQLELYRDTKESILLATQQPHCLRDMSPAARDRAFQREMRAEKNLHPALLTPDGHYKFLKAVSEGAVAYLLDMSDLQRTAPRVVCRELLASCVFRPLMGWAQPYYANKALYAMLRETTQKRSLAPKEAGEVSAALAAARSEAMRGHWAFEQRLLQHVAAEDSALSAAKELRHRLRSKLSQHSRSRSMDSLPGKLEPEQPQRQQQQQAQLTFHVLPEHRMHARASSSSPAVHLPAATAASTGDMPKTASSPASGTGSMQRGVSGQVAAQPKPPRPPLPQQQQQTEGHSPFDVYNVASAVASVLLPGVGSAAPSQQQERQQQQRADGEAEEDTPRLASGPRGWRLPAALGGLLPHKGQQEAETDESPPAGARMGAGGGDGWESVEPSDASLTLTPPRDFSSAHLLAPLVDQKVVATVTPRATSGSSTSSAGGNGSMVRAGFCGTPHAKVVAADLNTSSSKDFVEFKIRVADDGGEWTVSRRYRNFESLHRQLKAYPTYRLKLPPKRIFVHSNNVEFVEERREGLDLYLQTLLSHLQLAHCSDLYEFLRAGSQLYELAAPDSQRLQTMRRAVGGADKQQQQQQQQRKMLGELSRAVLDGTQSVGRGITSASGAVAGSVKQGVSELATAATGSVARVTTSVAGAAGAAAGAVKGALANSTATEQRPGLAGRASSHPGRLERESCSSIEGAGEHAILQRGSSGNTLGRDKGSGLLSRASNRLLNAINKEPTAGAAAVPQQHQHQQQLEPSGHSVSASSIDSERLAEQHDGMMPDARRASSSASLSASESPAKKASKLFSSLRRNKSRSASPTKQPRDRSPTRRQRRGAEGGNAAISRRNSSDVPALGSGRTGEAEAGLPAHLVSSLRATSPDPSSPLASFPLEPTLDLDDCAGISAPLYEMVDCLFMLQTRGFFRRQVFAVARQALSLVAGEAIDGYLISKLRLLRQQHTIGRIISQVQASLWPGGIWFQYTPSAQAAAAAAAQRQKAQQEQQHLGQQQRQGGGAQTGSAAASTTSCGSSGVGSGGYVRPAGMDPENFLDSASPPPLDEEEIREAVEALLLRRAPTALVRLIGKNAYASGMQDLFGMLQSQTYCHHLGYGVLEIAMVHLFPELKPLFRTLQHGGLM